MSSVDKNNYRYFFTGKTENFITSLKKAINGRTISDLDYSDGLLYFYFLDGKSLEIRINSNYLPRLRLRDENDKNQKRT